jgi:hypothetical protein
VLDENATNCVLPISTEMNRIRLVLYEMNDRKFGPHMAAIDPVPISVQRLPAGAAMDAGQALHCTARRPPSKSPSPTRIGHSSSYLARRIGHLVPIRDAWPDPRPVARSALGVPHTCALLNLGTLNCRVHLCMVKRRGPPAPPLAIGRRERHAGMASPSSRARRRSSRS